MGEAERGFISLIDKLKVLHFPLHKTESYESKNDAIHILILFSHWASLKYYTNALCFGDEFTVPL